MRRYLLLLTSDAFAGDQGVLAADDLPGDDDTRGTGALGEDARILDVGVSRRQEGRDADFADAHREAFDVVDVGRTHIPPVGLLTGVEQREQLTGLVVVGCLDGVQRDARLVAVHLSRFDHHAHLVADLDGTVHGTVVQQAGDAADVDVGAEGELLARVAGGVLLGNLHDDAVVDHVDHEGFDRGAGAGHLGGGAFLSLGLAVLALGVTLGQERLDLVDDETLLLRVGGVVTGILGLDDLDADLLAGVGGEGVAAGLLVGGGLADQGGVGHEGHGVAFDDEQDAGGRVLDLGDGGFDDVTFLDGDGDDLAGGLVGL